MTTAETTGLHPFLQALAGGVLLGDGGVGTLLYARGVPEQVPLDSLNRTAPHLVERVHLDYIRAGARLIETNTFSANRLRLAPYGLAAEAGALNLWGAKIARRAREVAGESVFVAGSVGPLGARLAPFGPVSEAEAAAIFREQVEGLVGGGVDLVVLETFSDLRELALAVQAARAVSRLPLVAQVTFSEEGESLDGATPEAFAELLRELGDLAPDVAGINCGTGPLPALGVLRRLAACLDPGGGCPPGRGRPYLSAMPNAGLPGRHAGRVFFTASPRYFAERVGELVRAGARLVGGCCGTTPEHIGAMRRALEERGTWSPVGPGGTLSPRNEGSTVIVAGVQREPVPPGAGGPGAAAGEGSPLAAALAGGNLISVELDPPRGAVPRRYLEGAALLARAGVTTVNIADSPMARVRMSCLAAARLVLEATGLSPIVHFTTRDRNLMGIQSDLLGAHALGIHNILALTGDPPSLGGYAQATAVYDVDSIGLVRILADLNRGVDISGQSIGEPTRFTIGVALSPNAPDLAAELERFRQKVAGGAHFAMTQPLYEVEPLLRVLERLGGAPIPLVLGVMPLHSARHAEYLHNEVPGISIPSRVREAMARAGEDGERVGLDLALRVVEAARPYVAGVYVVPSFGKYESAAALVRELRRSFFPVEAGRAASSRH